MATRSEDAMRLVDITDSIREVIAYTGEAKYEDFSGREDLRKAVVAQLGQIGGAAALLTDEFKEEHGEIDWDVLKGLQYAHFDDELEMDAHSLWYLVHNDLPELNDKLEGIVSTLEDDQDLDQVALNEEDKRDIQNRYRQKEAKVSRQEEDIKYEDTTPPLNDLNVTDNPEQNFIESEDDRREGPFNP